MRDHAFHRSLSSTCFILNRCTEPDRRCHQLPLKSYISAISAASSPLFREITVRCICGRRAFQTASEFCTPRSRRFPRPLGLVPAGVVPLSLTLMLTLTLILTIGVLEIRCYFTRTRSFHALLRVRFAQAEPEDWQVHALPGYNNLIPIWSCWVYIEIRPSV